MNCTGTLSKKNPPELQTKRQHATATHCNTLQHTASRCITPLRRLHVLDATVPAAASASCSTSTLILWCVSQMCISLHTATYCNTPLQHTTATHHCNAHAARCITISRLHGFTAAAGAAGAGASDSWTTTRMRRCVSQMGMSHVTHANASCHTCGCAAFTFAAPPLMPPLRPLGRGLSS